MPDAGEGDAGGGEPGGSDRISVAPALVISTDNEPRDAEAAADVVANNSQALFRYPYPTQQWAASCVRGRLPNEEDFFVVDCRELYDGGISFYSPVAIEAETLVISLGNRGTLVFMLARRLSQQVQADEQAARWLVECQFIRRVREDAGRWARALKAVPLTADAS